MMIVPLAANMPPTPWQSSVEGAGCAAQHEAELVEAVETAQSEPRHLAVTIEAYALK